MRCPSMGELKEINEFESEDGRVLFEPSEFYVHEVLKFKVKHSSARDKVKTFNMAKDFWNRDRFLTNCHPKSHLNDKSREGRKLHISDYYKRMNHTPL